ncbi:glycosyltransferase family 2 protein [Vagococcus lutrae]|uniref:Glycosyltransferase family 2 protein n=1 Tax=Vagococcus lutrae TaxID=81947 RepID=A0AAE9XG42_9ENTE|nr:glycosyltransferase family 2 protein [Vagococcus lutrae]WCG22707.1 glycosyltransferase family 2 protein [Vagococcus lutrae]
MGKRISIIIPHYNSVNKLKRLLQSIEIKKYQELLEVIIIDDKSTDDTSGIKEIVDSSVEMDLYFYLNNGVKGAGTCRNLGIEKAIGEWIIFADADDYFLPDYISTLCDDLNSSADIIYFLSSSMDEKTNELSDRHEGLNNLILSYQNEKTKENEILLRTKFLVPWSKMYRTEFIKTNDIKFDEILVSNDVMFSVKSGLLANEIQTSRKHLYCVTKDSGTLTTSYDKDKFNIRINTLLNYNLYLKKRLSKETYKMINITGLHWLIESNYYEFSLAEKLRLIKIFRDNKIPIISIRQINIEKVKRNIKKILKTRQNKKKELNKCQRKKKYC